MKHNSMNYRKADLPPNCGSCVFREWDEDGARCLHPCRVSRFGLAAHVAEMANNGGMNAKGIAESLLEDAVADQDHADYFYVCDNYAKDGLHKSAVILRDAEAGFVELITSLMPKG